MFKYSTGIQMTSYHILGITILFSLKHSRISQHAFSTVFVVIKYATMATRTDIEIAVKNGDLIKVKEFIENGGNIYKEYDKETDFYLNETLISKACRKKKCEIVEVLLNVYERDYKIAERAVILENEKNDLLKFIFVAWTKEDIEEVVKISETLTENSKKILVLLADRKEGMLVPINKNYKLFNKLFRNGLVNINCRDKYGVAPGHLIGKINRLDFLKRMIAIGFNFKEILPEIELSGEQIFIEKIIRSAKCFGLVKYCLEDLNIAHENLLFLTAKNKNIPVFECVLDFLTKNCKKDFLQKFFDENPNFVEECCKFKNYKLLTHILTEYNIKMTNKKDFFSKFFKLEESKEYIFEIIELKSFDLEEVLEALDSKTIPYILSTIWNEIPKENFKKIEKLYIKLISLACEHNLESEILEYINLLDPKLIYDPKTNNTALFIALQEDCFSMVQNLILRGANLLHRNNEQETCLIVACEYSSTEIIRLILKSEPSLINEVDSNGFNPLAELVHRDNSFIEIFNKMIRKGANPHVVDINNNSLLHNAVLAQNLEFVKLCLNLGVDSSIKGENGNTALHLCTKKKSLEIFNTILTSDKIDLESKNSKGNTILHNACKSYYPHYFFSLVEKLKPNINSVNNDGESPIFLCVDIERFRKIIEMGADTTIVAQNNFPFYLAAANWCRTDIIEFILRNLDVDLTITTNDGETLLHYLADRRIGIDGVPRTENLKDLFRKCTNTVRDFLGKTALQCAWSNTNFVLIKDMFEYSEPTLEHRNEMGETAIFTVAK